MTCEKKCISVDRYETWLHIITIVISSWVCNIFHISIDIMIIVRILTLLVKIGLLHINNSNDIFFLKTFLIYWGQVTHICVGNLTIIGSDNGLSPGILLIGPLGTKFSEILIKIHTFSFRKIHLKMSSGKWRPFCLSLNVLIMHLCTM